MSGGMDNTVRVWDAATGARVQTLGKKEKMTLI